jgi:hypothetical protein
VVPTCRPCRRSTPASSKGKLTPGKLVIDLATCRGLPAAVPVPTIDGGQAGHRVAVPVVPTIDAGKRAESGRAGHRPGKRRGLPRGRARADYRQREADAGKPVIVSPVVPMIDAGQFQGQADAGQGGHRVAVPVVPTIDAGASVSSPGKLVIDLASAGAFPRPCPCRRSTPASSKEADGGQLGKLVIVPPVVAIHAT